MSVANGASLDWQGPDRRYGCLDQRKARGTLVLGNDNQYAAGSGAKNVHSSDR